MNQIKLIASDLDSTLLDGEGKLPAGIFPRIEQLHARGIHFVAASGRPIPTLQKLFGPAVHHMTLLGENGGDLYRDGKLIYTNPMPQTTYQALVHFAREQHAGIPVLCAPDAAYIDAQDRDKAGDVSNFFVSLHVVDDLEKLDTEIVKFTTLFPQGGAYEGVVPYRKQFAHQLNVTVGGKWFLDIMNQDTNKGNGLKRLGELLNVQPSEMMAFGDTYNDIEMLETVHYSYLVANAAADMDAYAKYRTASNVDGGVLQVIDKVLAGAPLD